MKIDQHDYKEMKKGMTKVTAVVYKMQNRGTDVGMPYIYNPLISKFPADIAVALIRGIHHDNGKSDLTGLSITEGITR
uniref:Uncharacterized protein n=1 Tax=Caenorhabditis japonica TaxID=281687 RepID=A0A8R1IHJ6_CAEJA